MKTIEFRFEVGQKVLTPFGDSGIVKMAAVDVGGNSYYVQMKATEQWHLEKDLSERTD